jgi:hypothetical protein
MIVNMSTLSAADTAVVLRLKLGDIRSWPSFLSDGVRERQHVCGHQLHPCCYQKGASGFETRYDQHDIAVFVNDVLRDEPRAGRTPIRATVIAVNTARPWRLNKFDRLGTPMAILPRPMTGMARMATHV